MSEENNTLPVALEKINELSEQMGFNEENKTVFEMRAGSEGNLKELVLKSGEWDEAKPMFVYDKENPDKTYVFISSESFAALLKTLQDLNQENFNLKLEKAIWKHTPIDFQDVWVVAMDTIQKIVNEKREKGENVTLDLDGIVGKIKRDHPALFLNLADVMKKIGQ